MRTLRPDGYTIYTANSADEAMDLLQRHSVDVIVSDQQMPDRLGTEFLSDAQQAYPHTVRIILSGAADIADISKAMHGGAIYKFLTKPIDPMLLRANVAEAFGRARILRTQLPAQDPVTMLPTREYLASIFAAMVDDALTASSELCLFKLRIAQYENVLGSFGAACAAQFVRALAARLRTELSEDWFVGTAAEGQFYLLVSDPDATFLMELVTEKFNSIFARPFVVNDQSLTVNAEVGAGVSRFPHLNFDELSDQAHIAMLTAGGVSGASVQLYEPELSGVFRTQLRLETDLREAVGKNAFEVYYQPQVEIATGTIIGLEALLRWPNAGGGFTSPCTFIPVAERIGLINTIGAWVLTQAVTQMRAWEARGIAPQEIAVNVSAIQLRDSAFVAQVGQTLESSGLPPNRLVLEITESVTMDADEAIAASLQQLNALGVVLAIDDFGTGYSNLGHLTRHAFTKLKIDRSLIPHVDDLRGCRLFRNVVAMAQELGLNLVAEGVETPDELATVYRALCPVVQGYFYSPAVRASQLDKLLGSRFAVEGDETKSAAM
jgi:EAL domain-containing protein (putative c-di-GMP-specific phosphodiesterase class I)/GGDEF domain-containing protein